MFDDDKTAQSAAPFAFELVGIRGPLTGQRYPLGLDTVTLGRTPDNVVQLQSARASRRHCEIRVSHGQIVLVDLNSSNGTYLNTQRVASQSVLQPGDEVAIGDEAYVVVRTGGDPANARAGTPPPAPAAPNPFAAGMPPAGPPPAVPPAGGGGGLFGAPPGPSPYAPPPPAGPPPGTGPASPSNSGGLFGAPPGPSPFAAPPPAPMAPPPPLPIPSFLGVNAPPAPFGAPPPVARVSHGFVDEKTEPPPAMPGFMPNFNAPAAPSTGFAPVQAQPAPRAPAAPSGAKTVACPSCGRAVDARYSHCPYDATELPGAKPSW